MVVPDRCTSLDGGKTRNNRYHGISQRMSKYLAWRREKHTLAEMFLSYQQNVRSMQSMRGKCYDDTVIERHFGKLCCVK